jgi:hypothetical protein
VSSATRDRISVATLAVAAAVPAVVSGILAVTGKWATVIDNAVIAVRTHDAFSAHPPLLGQYTTLTTAAHSHDRLYHLGPLEYWLLAPFARAGGPSGIGLAVGASLVNALAVAGIIWLAHRLGGVRVAALAAVAVALLTWSLGGQVLHDPWNPHIALLPLVFVMVAVWSLATGDVWVLPPAAAAASFVTQAYLPFVVVTGLLLLWGLLALGFALRRRRAELSGDDWYRLRRRVAHAATVAAVVSVLCWSGPIIDQVAGKGNLTAVFGAGLGGGYPKLGAGVAWDQLIHATTLPPAWLHPVTAIVKGDPSPSGISIAISMLMVAALVAATVWAWRSHSRRLAAVGTTALVACAGAFITTASAPTTYLPEWVYPRRVWWVVGVFVWIALAYAALTLVTRRSPRDRQQFLWTGVAAPVAGVVAIVVALVATWPRLGPVQDYGSAGFGAVRALGSATAAALPGPGPWLVESRGELAISMVGPGVASELVYRGRRVLVRDSAFPDFGSSHVPRANRRAKGTVLVVSGSELAVPRPGYRLVAQWDPTTAGPPYRRYHQTMLVIPVGPVAVFVSEAA